MIRRFCSRLRGGIFLTALLVPAAGLLAQEDDPAEQNPPEIPTVPQEALPDLDTPSGDAPEGLDSRDGQTPDDPAKAAWEALIRKYGRRGRYTRDHGSVKEAFREVVAAARPAVATLYEEGEDDQIAFGTVVGPAGETLTKASELGDPADWADLRLVFPDDPTRYAVTVAGLHQESDLALVVPADATPATTPIRWALSDPLVGSWVVSPGREDLPLSVGIVSHTPRRIAGPDAVIGVQMDTGFGGKGVRLDKIFPDSGAEAAGLRVNDVVVRIDDEEIRGSQQLARAVRSHQPGDVLLLEVRRGEETLLFQVTLKARNEVPFGTDNRSDKQNTMGGEISLRRGGFDEALQHDGILAPAEVGGPLVNLDGEAVGLNIARGGRVKSYALPAEYVRRLLPDLTGGKFDPARAAEERLGTLAETLDRLAAKKLEIEDTLAERKTGRDEAEKAFAEARRGLAAAEAALAQVQAEIERARTEKQAAERLTGDADEPDAADAGDEDGDAGDE